ncbi:MAG: hydroxymethylbilane synthase [Candidatus Omnitrophota bacterium]|jgi:hydroxymethylbilane synthase
MQTKSQIRIGTRSSSLALIQATSIAKTLARIHPKYEFILVPIKTSGDKDQSMGLFQKQVGVFCKEIEEHLSANKIDIAVHSLKDLPTQLPNDLILGAYPKRVTAADVLITKKGLALNELKANATIATASIRRISQVHLMRSDIKCIPMRGNIDTRLKKLAQGSFDGIILALAGIKRLKLKAIKYKILPARIFISPPGQGTLGLQCRKKDPLAKRILKMINHLPTQYESIAERTCLSVLEGGCQIPAGIKALCKNDVLTITASVYTTNSSTVLNSVQKAPAKDAVKLGRACAKALIQMGAKEVIKNARKR